MTITDLQGNIKNIPPSFLKGLDTEERDIFKNYKLFPIELLVKADWNYKTEDTKRSKKLQNGLKKYGQIENIHVRKLPTGYYEVINGNHRLDDMIILGKKYVIAYDHGEISLSEAQRIAIQTNELKFDADPLKLGQILNELKLTFDEEELNDFIYIDPKLTNKIDIELNRNIENVDLEEDGYELTEQRSVKSERGDLYELNDHRLLVGDSTNSEDVAKLMNNKKAHLLFTDPPYNVNYANFNDNRPEGRGRNWTEEYCSDWQDSMSDQDYSKFLEDFLRLAKENMIEYAHYYVWFASRYYPELAIAFKNNELPFDGAPIIWVKSVAPITYAHYRKKYEPCFFGGKDSVTGGSKEGKMRWAGEVMDDNVWIVDRDHNNTYVHPTQKPLALPARALRNSTKKGEIVIDMFLGSGTTLICADEMDRICYGLEYEPRFADEIVKRFIKSRQKNNKEYQVKRNGELIDLDFFEELVNA